MKKLFFAFLLLLVKLSVVAQLYELNKRRTVFLDEANIREAPSLKARVIGTLRVGEEMTVCESWHKPDTINGIAATWIRVPFKGITGYIWQYTLATGTFTHRNGNRLLVKNDTKGISFKVLVKDSVAAYGSYTDKPYENYAYMQEVRLASGVQGNLYVKLNGSLQVYAFDGLTMSRAGQSESEELYQGSQKKVPGVMSPIITGDRVNLRDTPGLSGRIVTRLDKYATVKMIDTIENWVKIQGEYDYWYKVKANDKVGYVWGKSVALPMIHIYDNDDPNTTYLMCDHELMVLQKGKIVAMAATIGPFPGATLSSFGDAGFGRGYDFLVINSKIYECGAWGGDTYYLWDGERLRYFCASGGLGDGGYVEGETYTFPFESNGIPGKLIRRFESTNNIECIPVDDCEYGQVNATEFDISAVMSYTGDTLVEEPSKYLVLKQLAKREFPGFQLMQYKFGDINNDQVEDAVMHLRKGKVPVDRAGYDNESEKYKTKIVIVFGVDKDTFDTYLVNEHIIGEKEPEVNISINESNIRVMSYPVVALDEQMNVTTHGREIYNFTYQQADQKIYWSSFSVIDKKGLRERTFRTKKVLFENAWEINETPAEAEE